MEETSKRQQYLLANDTDKVKKLLIKDTNSKFLDEEDRASGAKEGKNTNERSVEDSVVAVLVEKVSFKPF